MDRCREHIPRVGYLAVAAIDVGIGKSPAAGMFHYVITVEGAFNGFLQNLVNNTQAGVITDMTTACALVLPQ